MMQWGAQSKISYRCVPRLFASHLLYKTNRTNKKLINQSSKQAVNQASSQSINNQMLEVHANQKPELFPMDWE